MARFEVIESKVWKRDDGATASIYGAVPWQSPSEEKRWKIVSRGYTVRDNDRGTVGIGRQPWPTRAEAQAWVDKETERLEEARRWSAGPKKSPAQLQREIDATLKKKGGRQPKRAHATKKNSDNAPRILKISKPKTFANQRSITATVQYAGESPSNVEFVGPSGGGSGPVVMVTRPSGHQTFVTDPSRFGSFGTDWVRRFFKSA